MRRLALCLFLLQEVDDEGLVITNKLVAETLGRQIVSKMLPPQRVKSFQRRKLRWASVAVGAP